MSIQLTAQVARSISPHIGLKQIAHVGDRYHIQLYISKDVAGFVWPWFHSADAPVDGSVTLDVYELQRLRSCFAAGSDIKQDRGLRELNAATVPGAVQPHWTILLPRFPLFAPSGAVSDLKDPRLTTTRDLIVVSQTNAWQDKFGGRSVSQETTVFRDRELARILESLDKGSGRTVNVDWFQLTSIAYRFIDKTRLELSGVGAEGHRIAQLTELSNMCANLVIRDFTPGLEEMLRTSPAKQIGAVSKGPRHEMVRF